MVLVEVRNQEENDKLVSLVKNLTESNDCGKNFTLGMREDKGCKAQQNFLVLFCDALKLPSSIGDYS